MEALDLRLQFPAPLPPGAAGGSPSHHPVLAGRLQLRLIDVSLTHSLLDEDRCILQRGTLSDLLHLLFLEVLHSLCLWTGSTSGFSVSWASAIVCHPKFLLYS